MFFTYSVSHTLIMDIFELIDNIDEDDLDLMEISRVRVYRERNNPFDYYDDEQFKNKYRYSKSYGQKIVDLLKYDLPHDRRGDPLDPQIQVACALRCWARHQIQDDNADLHGISQQVVSKICKNVAAALAKKAPMFINMPSTLEEEESTIRNFRMISNFPSVIGAIDCTHVKIKKVSGELSEAYVNRKGFYSLNIQVVCDADLKIRDVVARWRGSVHDSRIFNECSLKERFERGDFHGRLLGDSGYGCTPYLFTPILNPANLKEEAYNRAHIQTRNTIERCFGLWKQRFRCLLRGMHMKLSTAKTTVVALAVLHNIAIDMKEGIEDIVQNVHQHRHSNRNIEENIRGNIARRNFVQQHF